MLKVGTFCSGVGSPEQALKDLGIEHEIMFASEIDAFARQTYLANFSPKIMDEDMTKPSYEEDKWYADLCVAGLPCQSFSLAGRRMGEKDKRGLLIYDFHRWLKAQKPKYFILENVKGLLYMRGKDSGIKGEVFQNWLKILGRSVNGVEMEELDEDTAGYNLHWKVLNTKNFGVPQSRDRVFIIGIREDLPNYFVFPEEFPLRLRLKDILEDEVDEKYYLSEKMLQKMVVDEGRGKINDDIPRRIIVGHSGTGGQRGAIHDINGISSCLSATDYKQPIQILVESTLTNKPERSFRIRRLSPLECFRLQAFPDDFVKPCSNSQLYRQAGNTITVNVIRGILASLLLGSDLY